MINRWTQSSFHELPEGPPFYELHNGVLVEMPKPRLRHQEIVAQLIFALLQFLRENKIGKAWPEIEVDLTSRQTFVPDITFLATENFSQLNEGQRILGAPELVIEVASPSTASYDKSTKLLAYQEAGVPWYWIVEDNLLITEYKNSPDGYIVNQVAVAGDEFTPSAFLMLTFNLAELMGE